MRMTDINVKKPPSREIDVVELDDKCNRVNVAQPRKVVVKSVKPSYASKYVQDRQTSSMLMAKWTIISRSVLKVSWLRRSVFAPRISLMLLLIQIMPTDS